MFDSIRFSWSYSYVQPLLTSAKDAIYKGQYSAAIEITTKLITEYPDVAIPHLIRAQAYTHKANYKDALKDLQSYFSSFSFLATLESNLGTMSYLGIINAMYYRLQGICLHQLEQYEQSLEPLLKAHAAYPDNVEIMRFLGRSYYELQKWDLAEQVIKQAIILDSNNTVLWQNLAFVYQADKKITEAQHCYHQILKLHPQHPEGLLGLAGLAHENNLSNPEEILKLINTYFNMIKPDETQKDNLISAEFIRASKLIELKHYDDAEKSVKQLASFGAPKNDILRLRNLITLGLNKKEESKKIRQEPIENYPSKELDNFSLSIIYFKEQKYDLALKHMLEFIKKNPTNISALIYRGNIYMGLEDYKNAINDFDKVIKISPIDIKNVICNLAIANDRIGDNRQAEQDYETCVKIFPNERDIKMQRTNFYLKIAKFQEAINGYTELLTTVKNFLLFNQRGNAYLQNKNYKEARIDFQYALQLADTPNQKKVILTSAAFVEFYDNKIEQAIIKIEEALNLNPQDFLLLMYNAIFQLKMRNFKEAEKNALKSMKEFNILSLEDKKKFEKEAFAINGKLNSLDFEKALANFVQLLKKESSQEIEKFQQEVYKFEKVVSNQKYNYIKVDESNSDNVFIGIRGEQTSTNNYPLKNTFIKKENKLNVEVEKLQHITVNPQPQLNYNVKQDISHYKSLTSSASRNELPIFLKIPIIPIHLMKLSVEFGTTYIRNLIQDTPKNSENSFPKKETGIAFLKTPEPPCFYPENDTNIIRDIGDTPKEGLIGRCKQAKYEFQQNNPHDNNLLISSFTSGFQNGFIYNCLYTVFRDVLDEPSARLAAQGAIVAILFNVSPGAAICVGANLGGTQAVNIALFVMQMSQGSLIESIGSTLGNFVGSFFGSKLAKCTLSPESDDEELSIKNTSH